MHCAIVALFTFAACAMVAAHNVAPEPTVDVFLQPGPSQLAVKIWLPMAALADANLPRTPDGRFNQDQIRPALDLVARGIARDLELQQGADPLLAPTVATTLSPDESFVAVDLNYPIAAAATDFSGRFHPFRSTSQMIPTIVHYLVDAHTTRTFVVDTEPQRIFFSPTIVQVFRHFIDRGTDALFEDADFVLFAVCLIAVARRPRTLSVAVGSLLAGQLLTIVAAVAGLLVLTPTNGAALAATAASATVVLAIQDVASPQSRWLPALCFVFGALSAAPVGATLAREHGFAGAHGIAGLFAYVAIVALGEIWAIALLTSAAGLIRRRGRMADLAVLSTAIFAGHAALHRVLDQGQQLADAGVMTLDRLFITLTLAWAGVILSAGIIGTLVALRGDVNPRLGVPSRDM